VKLGEGKKNELGRSVKLSTVSGTSSYRSEFPSHTLSGGLLSRLSLREAGEEMPRALCSSNVPLEYLPVPPESLGQHTDRHETATETQARVTCREHREQAPPTTQGTPQAPGSSSSSPHLRAQISAEASATSPSAGPDAPWVQPLTMGSQGTGGSVWRGDARNMPVASGLSYRPAVSDRPGRSRRDIEASWGRTVLKQFRCVPMWHRLVRLAGVRGIPWQIGSTHFLTVTTGNEQSSARKRAGRER
jgi:hypothetical protein